MIKKEPVLIGRYWHMPDGGIVPNIYGANGEGAGDGEGAGGEASGGAGGEASGGTGGTGEDEHDFGTERLKKDLKSTRAEAAAYRRKLRELEEKIDGVDIDKYQTLVEQEAELERRKMEEKGEYDRLVEEHKRKSEAQLQKAQESITGWKQRYERQVIDNVLLSAANEKAVSSSEAVTLIRANYTFGVNDEGDVEITSANGETLFDEDGNTMTPQAIMSKFLEERPYLCKPTGGGTGSRGAKSPGRSSDNADTNLHGAARIAAALRKRAANA